jgi:hypothetical protein
VEEGKREWFVRGVARGVHEHAEPEANTAIASGLQYVADKRRTDASTFLGQ